MTGRVTATRKRAKEAVMYCPRCGTETADSAAFCQNCGQPLASGAGQGAPQTESSQPVYRSTSNQGMATGTVPRIPSHLGWAILSILLFWPTGIAAVVYASRVDNLVVLGNIAAAQEASGKARLFSIISTVAFVIWLVIVIIVAATAGSVYRFYG
jgi:hypothetical protein